MVALAGLRTDLWDLKSMIVCGQITSHSVTLASGIRQYRDHFCYGLFWNLEGQLSREE